MPGAPEIIVATTTPYSPDGSVDAEAYRRELRRIAPFVDGVFACGTTGEFPALDDDERTALIRVAVEELGPARTIAHVGGASTRQSLRLAAAAADVGATRFAAITPYYLRAGVRTVAAHYAALRDALPRAALYGYLYPDVAGTDVLPSELPALVDAGIDGIKTSGVAATRVADYLDEAPEGFALWSGGDADLPAVVAAGGRGLVSGVAGVVPEVFAAHRSAIAAGDSVEAEAVHVRIRELVAALGSSIRRLKLGLDLRGGAGGATRMSVDALDADVAARIRALVAD